MRLFEKEDDVEPGNSFRGSGSQAKNPQRASEASARRSLRPVHSARRCGQQSAKSTAHGLSSSRVLEIPAGLTQTP